MDTPILRILPFAEADGPTNMARDEAMLGIAADGEAVLRFYAWTPATVSLGYFQSHTVRQQHPHLQTVPFVRRASGGMTLVHDHELTYSLALPDTLIPETNALWLTRMHQVIAGALREFDVSCDLADVAGPPSSDCLCFHHITPGDILIDSHKVVGSAQRKSRGALLQHGGILLARSDDTPTLPGIRELTGVKLEVGLLMDRIVKHFQEETRWRVERQDWSDTYLVEVERIVRDKYLQAAWNEKR